MSFLARNIVGACWGVFFVTWIVAAFFTKRTVYRETSGQRLGYVIPIVIGWYLVFRGGRLPHPFSLLVVPQTPIVLGAAAILSVIGLAICLWARVTLGRNWSGIVTLKEDHELVVHGPYRLVRHPIYTGVLALVLATMLLHAHIAALLGLFFVFVGFWMKLAQEEELMLRQFPVQYAAYRARVKRIIPFVL